MVGQFNGRGARGGGRLRLGGRWCGRIRRCDGRDQGQEGQESKCGRTSYGARQYTIVETMGRWIFSSDEPKRLEGCAVRRAPSVESAPRAAPRAERRERPEGCALRRAERPEGCAVR
jgi:hypothetical protein